MDVEETRDRERLLWMTLTELFIVAHCPRRVRPGSWEFSLEKNSSSSPLDAAGSISISFVYLCIRFLTKKRKDGALALAMPVSSVHVQCAAYCQLLPMY